MKPLEDMGATAMTVMNTMYDWSKTTRIKCGQIQGQHQCCQATTHLL